MVKQYPHTITFIVVQESTQDDIGNWLPAGDPVISAVSGRAEPAGSGRIVQLADGSQVVYNWVVYMPKGTAPVPDGTQVDARWTDSGQLVGQGKCLRFSQGQLNSRLWL